MTRRLALGGGVLAAAALAAGAAALGGDEDPGAPAAARAAGGATATVERRDLVDRDEVDGTLGYADPGTLVAGTAGTITALRAPGAVVRRGGSLYGVDGAPAAFLLYGRLPAWRDFTPWMEDGADIRQLERNLRALGLDPDGELEVDDEWDAATTAAVERFQEDRGLTEDGSLEQGEVVFRRGPTRIGEARAAVGEAAAPGRELGDLSSTERRVTVDLDATRQQLARTGDAVTVALPDGADARGRIRRVGTVAEQPADEEGGGHDRGHDRAARQGRPRHRPRPGAGRRRVRGGAPPRRADRAGQGAARAPGRRVRRRAGRRPAGRRSRPGSTPTTSSRSRATCARATPW